MLNGMQRIRPIGSGAMFGPEHLAGLRPGSDHQAWAPAGGGLRGLAGPGPGAGVKSL